MDTHRRGGEYHPGYHLHSIQVKIAGRDWEAWADATVAALDPGEQLLVIEYLDGRRCRLWRHRFDFGCPVGTPVRVCERWHVLAIGSRWLSVDALDRAPHPERPVPFGPDYHGPSGRLVLVDLSNGEGIDVDHPDEACP
jgi:hypothetical protein